MYPRPVSSPALQGGLAGPGAPPRSRGHLDASVAVLGNNRPMAPRPPLPVLWL